MSSTLNIITVYLYRYVLPVMGILGNLGNLLSILIFIKKTWRKNVCVFYFSIYLICNTGFINFYMLSTVFINGYSINAQNSSVLLCKLYIYAGFLFSTLFPTILILASIDRLLISSQNVDTRLYSSKRLAYFSISISTIFWVIFFLHVLIKSSVYRLYAGFYFCYFDTTNNYVDFVSYSSLIINGLICLTIIILAIFAYKNVRRIRAIPARQQRRQVRSMSKKDFQLLRCLYVHDIVYIVCSIPVNIYYVYETATKNIPRTAIRSAIENFSLNFFTFLHDIPYCISFLIFLFVSRAFQTELKRMVNMVFRRDIITIRSEEENNVKQNAVVVVVVS